MAPRLYREIQQQQRKPAEAVRVGGCFLRGEAEQHREIRERPVFELVLVQLHQIREILSRCPGGGKIPRGDAFETQLRDGLGQSVRESRRLGHRREILQFIRVLRGVRHARCDGLDAEPADGRERPPAHGLRSEVGRELQQRERVYALRALLESCDGELMRGSPRGSKNQNFGFLSVNRKKRSRAFEQLRTSAATEQRSSSHKQLYCRRASLRLASCIHRTAWDQPPSALSPHSCSPPRPSQYS